jgi:hypothetical protein
MSAANAFHSAASPADAGFAFKLVLRACTMRAILARNGSSSSFSRALYASCFSDPRRASRSSSFARSGPWRPRRRSPRPSTRRGETALAGAAPEPAAMSSRRLFAFREKTSRGSSFGPPAADSRAMLEPFNDLTLKGPGEPPAQASKVTSSSS